MSTTLERIEAVRQSLSPGRMSTYESATVHRIEEESAALDLYAWNAQISAALLAPLHICEVVVRNAVSDVLQIVYGERWPWSHGFEQSLPSPTTGYNPRKDLVSIRLGVPTTGKLIPELNFFFWQKMFTNRYDQRLWNTHLMHVLPNLNPAHSIGLLRHRIYEQLDALRRLRNRIAHHEPIFNRDLLADLQRIVILVEFRCKVTAGWMMANQQASTILKKRP
jgi:hypothetical protein